MSACRFLLTLGWLSLLSQSAYAQTLDQPTVAFPFQVALTAPADSSQASSGQVLAAGKPVVLAFWLSTCAPCMHELAAYTAQWAAWQQQADFQLLAISIDFPERFGKVRQLVAEKKWPFPAYWDGLRGFKDILPGGLNGLPQVFVFDKKGKLVYHHRKYMPGDEVALFEAVKAAR